MVNMDESVDQFAVRGTKVELADAAHRPVVVNAQTTGFRIPLVSVHQHLLSRTFRQPRSLCDLLRQVDYCGPRSLRG